MKMKPLPEKSLNVFCDVFEFSKGQADITCPASTYPIACLRACERRGLLVWDIENVNGETKRWCALTPMGATYGCETLALAADGINDLRQRVWVRVQFDLSNEDYQEAYQIAGELARARLLAPTIRDCLLIHNLADDGDYSLFYQLYGIPNTKETMQFESMIQAFSGMQKTMSDLLEENRLLRQQLEASQGANLPRISDFGNDDETILMSVVKDENSAKQSASNFIKSVMALNPVQADNGNPRQLSVQQFEVPDYEDEDDENLFG